MWGPGYDVVALCRDNADDWLHGHDIEAARQLLNFLPPTP